jgi:hypothetical protein
MTLLTATDIGDPEHQPMGPQNTLMPLHAQWQLRLAVAAVATGVLGLHCWLRALFSWLVRAAAGAARAARCEW